MTSPFKVLVAGVALAMIGLAAHAASENLLSDNSTFGTAQIVGPFTSDGLSKVLGSAGRHCF